MSFRDLTGMKFNKLTVISRDNDVIGEDSKTYKTWRCKCDCGNEIVAFGRDLTLSSIYSCGCSKPERMKVRKDISGNKYGSLTVIQRADDIIYKDNKSYPAYLCKCECGNECIKAATYLKGSNNPCCDECVSKKQTVSRYRDNIFIHKEDCCEILCSNSDQTIKIDTEDEERVSKHCWYVHKSDKCDTLYYAYGKDRIKRNHLKMHKYILECDDDELVIDHINHNGLDNRKENLKVCFTNENSWNQIPKGNIPYKNITFNKRKNKFVVSFKRYGECIYSTYCNTLDEAVNIRNKVEQLANEAYIATQTICIDIDNVICNTTECVLNKINEMCDTSYAMSDIKEYSIEAILPDDQKHIVSEIFEDKTMWKNVKAIPHAVEVIRNLYLRGYKILFATATTSTNFNPKIRFLKRIFSFLNCEDITICVKNKQILQCDYLIDDSPSQLLNGSYKGIALKYPWNENVEGFEKCNNWWEIYKIIVKDHQQIHNAQYIKDYIKVNFDKGE